jgi:hypothetical protein
MLKKPIITKRKKNQQFLLYPLKLLNEWLKGLHNMFKLARVPLRYPCIIYFSFKHHVLDCPRKIKVQNMFWIKSNTIIIVAAKNPKPDNVQVNVVTVVMKCS